MEILRITGGKRLYGETTVQGAKNSVLPCLAAAVLGRSCVIHNCPDLKDTRSAIEILKCLGITAEFSDNTVITHFDGEINHCISDGLMKEMRSSVVFLGAILSRAKRAEISYPGGCSIGARPIDLHLKAFRQMGVTVEEEKDRIFCSVDKLKSTRIHLDFPSVGATENIMLLGAVSDAEIELLNGAKEPEILDLQNFINSMGGDISRSGDKIIIKGQKALYDTEYKIMPDRIAVLTYLCAVCACGGRGRINCVRPEHIALPLKILEKAGSQIEAADNHIEIKSPKRPKGFGFINTQPYPGFPTDAQAIFMAAAARGAGKTCFAENIFENRFHHARELIKLGADISVCDNTAFVTGKRRLYGGRLTARDLRGGASLVIGALSARGTSIIENIGFIDRGYEKIERSLSDFGAEIVREQQNGREIYQERKNRNAKKTQTKKA